MLRISSQSPSVDLLAFGQYKIGKWCLVYVSATKFFLNVAPERGPCSVTRQSMQLKHDIHFEITFVTASLSAMTHGSNHV